MFATLKKLVRPVLAKSANAIVDTLIRNDCLVFRPFLIDRIGHLAGEVDLWLKERVLSGKRGKAFALIACEKSAANSHLLTYFRQYYHFVIPPSFWARLIRRVRPLKRLVVKRDDLYVAINETATCWPIYAAWGEQAPLFHLRDDDQEYLRTILRGWGLQTDSWFVCLHNRERGYSAADDDLHDYRNAPIESCLVALQEITKRGGWVIRMGDPAMTPLPKLPQVIDYAHSPLRCPRLDVCLSASARFFLGSSSGLFIVAILFGVPCGLTNLAPMSMVALTLADVGIPKLFTAANGKPMTFPEVMSSPLANYRYSEEYEKAGIRVESNSSEDIHGLVVEMLERKDRTCEYTEDDEDLQRRYQALFRPGHYGYGSLWRVGRDFLRAHRDLLLERSSDKATISSESVG